MTSWQPIETAPKDGSSIDVWGKHGRYPDAFWGLPPYGQRCWCTEQWHTTYDEVYAQKIEPQPTHWMPIPGGPEE